MEVATENELSELIEDWYEEPMGFEGVRHYGIWSDEIGRWWWRYMKVFVTTSKAVAKAQLTMILAGTEVSSPQEDLEPWRVRCIEEWADEQS